MMREFFIIPDSDLTEEGTLSDYEIYIYIANMITLGYTTKDISNIAKEHVLFLPSGQIDLWLENDMCQRVLKG